MWRRCFEPVWRLQDRKDYIFESIKRVRVARAQENEGERQTRTRTCRASQIIRILFFTFTKGSHWNVLSREVRFLFWKITGCVASSKWIWLGSTRSPFHWVRAAAISGKLFHLILIITLARSVSIYLCYKWKIWGSERSKNLSWAT